jgi:hypothetical protein
MKWFWCYFCSTFSSQLYYIFSARTVSAVWHFGCANSGQICHLPHLCQRHCSFSLQISMFDRARGFTEFTAQFYVIYIINIGAKAWNWSVHHVYICVCIYLNFIWVNFCFIMSVRPFYLRKIKQTAKSLHKIRRTNKIRRILVLTADLHKIHRTNLVPWYIPWCQRALSWVKDSLPCSAV